MNVSLMNGSEMNRSLMKVFCHERVIHEFGLNRTGL